VKDHLIPLVEPVNATQAVETPQVALEILTH
jgi:hypothetical protein